MARAIPKLLVLAMDIGSSSVRTALFDQRARHRPETNAQQKYVLRYSTDGGAELSPMLLHRAAAGCLNETFAAYRASKAMRKIPIAAVGGSGFWHSLLGLSRTGKPMTPVFTWADSRSTEDAERLRKKLSERAIQFRTGCMLRSSFWPAKLLWLRRTQPRVFAQVARWVSPADWIFESLFGASGSSASMASATGLFDQRKWKWDDELCEICAVRPDQLPAISESSSIERQIAAELRGSTIFSALGDGAASNLGAGADHAHSAAISIGTSAAVRVMRPRIMALRIKLPFGLFRYAVDADHFVVGGAISNAGNLRTWCLRELNVDADGATMRRSLSRSIAARDTMTILPFWVDERAPSWPDSNGGTITGLTQATTAGDLYRAATTSVFNRIGQILTLLESSTGRSRRIILSAGVVRSDASVRLFADVLGRDIEICRERETSLRGAALHAVRRVGGFPVSLGKGRIVRCVQKLAASHARRRERQVALEKLLAHFH